MSELDAELDRLPGSTAPFKRVDGWWMLAPELDVRAMAQFMNSRGARLSTITGVALDNGETELVYHYALGGTAINFKTRTRSRSIESIAAITRAASWIEREIHDLYRVEFAGHPNLTRLLRPPQLPEGFFRGS